MTMSRIGTKIHGLNHTLNFYGQNKEAAYPTGRKRQPMGAHTTFSVVLKSLLLFHVDENSRF